MLLADKLVQRPGPHPRSQWRLSLDLFLAGVIKKVHVRIVLEGRENTSQQNGPSC